MILPPAWWTSSMVLTAHRWSTTPGQLFEHHMWYSLRDGLKRTSSAHRTSSRVDAWHDAQAHVVRVHVISGRCLLPGSRPISFMTVMPASLAAPSSSSIAGLT